MNAELFSLSELLNSIDSSMIILGAIFVVSFALIYFALSKFFKTGTDAYGERKSNPGISGTISFAIAFLITYMINKAGLDFESIFSRFGFSMDVLYILVPLLVVGLIIFMIIKMKLNSLLLFGILLVALSFTSLITTKTVVIVIGLVLIGIWIWLKARKKKSSGRGSGLFD